MKFRTWCVDLAIAYGAGILVGAPVGLAAFRLTGSDEALSGTIVLSMIGLLLGRRVWRRRPEPSPPDPG
ncbi:MAG: hypothetical protein H0U94_02905 [Acidobacteria bacterium]|jgi:uncharacterized membrane protein YfcA|nr:hypothetical protein [Acidobacteriota bacterium]